MYSQLYPKSKLQIYLVHKYLIFNIYPFFVWKRDLVDCKKLKAIINRCLPRIIKIWWQYCIRKWEWNGHTLRLGSNDIASSLEQTTQKLNLNIKIILGFRVNLGQQEVNEDILIIQKQN